MVYIFIPKIPLWLNFGGHWKEKCFMIIWKNLQPFGIFNAHLVYIFRGQSVLFPVLVHFAKKHLATLLWTE
jgi:hypothetical protein